MARNAFSSLGASIAAYQPYYAPPVCPQTNYINGSPAWAQPIDETQQLDQHTSLVNRMPSMLGIRWLYSRGGQIKPWFRMIATGAVESTKFQPVLSHTWDGEFNDALYQAGYPRNLGYTVKVGTIPPAGLAQQRDRMTALPRITKPVFARRAYTSGVKAVPAVSTIPFNRRRGV